MPVKLLLLCFSIAIIAAPAQSLRLHSLPFQQQPGKGVGVRTPVTQLPPKNKRFALVIGVDEYDSRQISRLNGAVGDARVLADALVQYAGFPKEQVILLTTAEPPARRPSRSVILQYLSNLRGLVPQDGLLLIAFSGHGIERNGKAYLLPSDAISVGEDVALIEDTAISVDRMRSLIRATGVGQVMLILDACRNDPSAGKGDAPNLMTDALRRGFDFGARNQGVEAFVTLYSTAVGDRAYEYSEKGQGYFTWALVEGLKGAAANDKGEVTLGTLKSYVERTVPFKVQLELGKKQKPFAIVEGYQAEELVVALASAPTLVTKPPASAPVVPPAVRMSVAGVPLAAMSFTTVNTDARGNAVNQREEQCWGYVEDLGNGVKLELVEIPSGSFTMGSPGNEAERSNDEGPQHQVSVKGLLMGKTEVTQAQWRAVMGTNPSYFKGDDLPVEQVSWEEAKEFCRKLSARTGRNYRLPSEAEWEYAARAGTTTPFAFGPTISPSVVNYNGNYPYGSAAKGEYREKTVSAGSLPANQWGLQEMHGNVWEWCEDVWHDSYAGAPVNGSAWTSGGDQGRRVLRGGSWYFYGNHCRSAYRYRSAPGLRLNDIGFRVVVAARTP